MAQRPRRQRRIAPDIVQAIRERTRDGMGPTPIRRWLDETHLPSLGRQDELPSLRTVQDIARDAAPEDTSDAWTLADADADEAILVLPIVAESAFLGSQRRVTKREAGWIVRIRSVAPGLPIGLVRWLAAEYMVREDHEVDTADLDVIVGALGSSSPPLREYGQRLLAQRGWPVGGELGRQAIEPHVKQAMELMQEQEESGGTAKS